MKIIPDSNTTVFTHQSDVKRMLERAGENGNLFPVGRYAGDWGMGEGEFFVEVENYYEGKYINLRFLNRHSLGHCTGPNHSILEIMHFEDINPVAIRKLARYLLEATDWVKEYGEE